MGTINRRDRITRRGFLELGSAAIASAGLLPYVSAAKVAPRPGDTADTAKLDSALMTGKIALEEHFTLPEAVDADSSPGYALFTPELRLMTHLQVAKPRLKICWRFSIDTASPGTSAMP